MGEPLYAWQGVGVQEWQSRWGVPELHVFRTITSTNDYAARRAHDGAPAGTLVLAEHQSAGRGRRGRAWLAPPGTALLLSMVYRLPADKGGVPGAAPLRVGLAVPAHWKRSAPAAPSSGPMTCSWTAGRWPACCARPASAQRGGT
ncbi:MAG: hypothetical protein P8174_08905 [Gemmatimonadota bacterium]